MTLMNFFYALLSLLLITPAWSEPTTPVGQKLATLLGQPASATAPAATTSSGLSPSGAALPAASTTAAPAVPLTPPPPSPEQRRLQMLLDNAERIDNTNQGLLANKQKMLIQLEQLQTQVNVLKNDRSNEGIREGALAVIAGFLLGWFFANSRRKSW